MNFKAIAIKVLKGGIYGALGAVSALQFAGVTDIKQMGKGLLGAFVSGFLHGAHEVVKQANGK